MSDLVKRLRAYNRIMCSGDGKSIHSEAADRIEQLQAQVADLISAIGTHACNGRDCVGIYGKLSTPSLARCTSCEAVKAALNTKESE